MIIRNFLILAASLLFLCACSNSEPNQQTPMKKLSLGISIQPSSGLVIIAHEKHFFKDHGLDVEVKEYPSGKRALFDGLLAGEVDIASTTSVPFVMEAIEKTEIKAFATVFTASNVNSIIARKDKGINSPEDLINKKIGTQKASAVHFFLSLFLQKYNISINDVDLRYYKAEDLPQALAKGEIDAFSMREPYISQAQEQLKDNAVVFQEPGLYRQVEAVVVKSAYIDANQDIIISFLKSLYDAKELITNSPDTAKKILADKLGVSVESIETFWDSSEYNVSLSQAALIMMEITARWAILNDFTKVKTMPNLLENIYLDALEKLDPEAVSVFH